MSRKVSDRAGHWRQVISEQAGSGLSIREFCRRKTLREPSFYWWRRRLEESEPVRFALVETNNAAPDKVEAEPVLEVVLAGGDRIRIATGTDLMMLREVIQALRA